MELMTYIILNAYNVLDTVVGAWENRQKSLLCDTNILADLKSNWDLISEVSHKWAINMVNYFLLCK
jgi:hypothetical protein